MKFNKNNNLIIGISGVARSGKDTFGDLLKEKLEEFCSNSDSFMNNPDIKRVALATALKKEADEECISKFKISSFTQDPEEKKIIRPFLVSYGKEKRETTGGCYWTGLMQKQIDAVHGNVFIVSDIRYVTYENDEYQWLKKNGGCLVHVSRYIKTKALLIKPPNKDEAYNDPILESLADFNVVWPTTENKNIKNAFIQKFIEKIWTRTWNI